MLVSFRTLTTVSLLIASCFALGCGAKTGLISPDAIASAPPPDAEDVPPFVALGCTPVDDQCGTTEVCGNWLDDNCDGHVDEGCVCSPGMVQRCFAGPPGRRNQGSCEDGSQVCLSSGMWGDCAGGIVPRADVCNGADNLCTGCSQHANCPILCPSPGDSRVPLGSPFTDYPLRGEDFYHGNAMAWIWTIDGGPCDQVSQTPSFHIDNQFTRDATFVPSLSGDYTVHLVVVPVTGPLIGCSWIVHVVGPGLRIEMCYPENTTVDLDLYVHRPGSTLDWFPSGDTVFNPNADACSWENCEAHLRGSLPRADWGYANTPLSECVHGPLGAIWSQMGQCSNPRLDIDNNLSEATGVPENINIDNPREGDSFRIMVENFTGALARPLVNVYCSGARVSTIGAAPDIVPNFTGNMPPEVGAVWRVADVTTHVSGTTTTCDVHLLHPSGSARGYNVTNGDGSF